MADAEVETREFSFNYPDHIFRASVAKQNASSAVQTIYETNDKIVRLPTTRQIATYTLDEFCYQFEWLAMLEGLPLDKQMDKIVEFVFKIPLRHTSAAGLLYTLDNHIEVGLLLGDFTVDAVLCDVLTPIILDLVGNDFNNTFILANSVSLGLKSIYELGLQIRQAKSFNIDVKVLIDKYRKTIRYFQLPYHFDMLET